MEFEIKIDGVAVRSGTPGVKAAGTAERKLQGAVHYVSTYNYETAGLFIECHRTDYEGTEVSERWVTVRNGGERSVRLEGAESFVIGLPKDSYRLMYYTSGWGEEFESVYKSLDATEDFVLETRKGRSSRDVHPWFTLFGADGGMVSAAPMWSGNWAFRFRPNGEQGMEVSGGLQTWEFWKTLQPGDAFESVRTAVVTAPGVDLNDITVQYAKVGRAFWYPRNTLSESLPIEWNHWWSYEDKKINEETFLANVRKAAEMDIDICTLDAGWFGPIDPESNWYDIRGDWDMVNTVRFPNGIRPLADACHEAGMKFGLWCEIEALGKDAAIAKRRPDLPALRDGRPLGYVCFGNPQAREWAFETLDRLITEYRCDWIKLDFNLDPEAGCNREDHGHGAGDGLFEHYKGYYEVLSRVRAKHPEVLLESCSSGGLRIDLGLLRETHTTFLSDPDWPEHDLQVFWGASTMLAPNVCLHWGYCDWLGDHPKQKFNPRDPSLQPHQLDYYTRISMLGGFGFSQKLPELPEWVAERFVHHTGIYKEHVSRFVRTADVYRLTEQPKREGRGDRWAAFQYSIPESDEHLFYVFKLPGGEESRTFRLKRLDANAVYRLRSLGGGETRELSGSELMREGLEFLGFREQESDLILLEKRREDASACL